jgi:hypothetical protein
VPEDPAQIDIRLEVDVEAIEGHVEQRGVRGDPRGQATGDRGEDLDRRRRVDAAEAGRRRPS